jgi:hypothetical protein
MKSTIFWGVTPRNVIVFRRFRGTCHQSACTCTLLRTLVNFCRTTRHHIPAYNTANSHRCGTLISHKCFMCVRYHVMLSISSFFFLLTTPQSSQFIYALICLFLQTGKHREERTAVTRQGNQSHLLTKTNSRPWTVTPCGGFCHYWM